VRDEKIGEAGQGGARGGEGRDGEKEGSEEDDRVMRSHYFTKSSH
jgi:hypothetical protein